MLVCTVVGRGTPSGVVFAAENTGSKNGVCGKGGLLVAFPNRLPNTRSWKIPNAPRTDVLPLRNGSHANPRRGSKLLKLLSYSRCPVPGPTRLKVNPLQVACVHPGVAGSSVSGAAAEAFPHQFERLWSASLGPPSH